MGTKHGTDRETLTLLFELSRATRCCQQEAVFCEDVTFVQFYILDLVEREGSMRLADLHKALFVEKSTTTRLIEPLIERGLLVKEKLPDDARAVGLALTSQGRELHARVGVCVGEFMEALDAAIPASKREEVYAGVRLLLSVLRDACATRCC